MGRQDFPIPGEPARTPAGEPPQRPPPQAPDYQAPEPPAPNYQAPEPPAPNYQAPEPPAPNYQAPEPPAPNYQAPEPQAPDYEAPKPPSRPPDKPLPLTPDALLLQGYASNPLRCHDPIIMVGHGSHNLIIDRDDLLTQVPANVVMVFWVDYDAELLDCIAQNIDAGQDLHQLPEFLETLCKSNVKAPFYRRGHPHSDDSASARHRRPPVVKRLNISDGTSNKLKLQWFPPGHSIPNYRLTAPTNLNVENARPDRCIMMPEHPNKNAPVSERGKTLKQLFTENQHLWAAKPTVVHWCACTTKRNDR